jgi:hypothetical protein
MKKPLIPLLFAGLAFGCTGDAPTGGLAPLAGDGLSAAITANYWDDFDFFIGPCNGEPIDGSGKVHFKDTATFAQNGSVHLTFHINAKGKGVGQVTGVKYEWNDAINESPNIAPPFTNTWTRRFRLIGQGQVPDRFLDGIFHVTVNANGEVTSFKDEFTDTCR